MANGSSRVSNPASAMGEAAGKMFEGAVLECIRDEVVGRGYAIGPKTLVNGSGVKYQIDAVVADSNDNPIILIDPKYIRYTKHNRDKASWLCVAHFNLRKTYPTIRKSIAVLGGRWSKPSIELVRNFGVEIHRVPFEDLTVSFAEYGISFDWPERDREIPREALAAFEALDEESRSALSRDLVKGVEDDLRNAVNVVLDADLDTLPARITEVEILLKSDRGEFVMRTYDSVLKALQAMPTYLSDKSDISDLLEEE